jgi:hypothetical protein
MYLAYSRNRIADLKAAHVHLRKVPQQMKTSASKEPSKEFDELSVTDRARIIRQLEGLLEPLIVKNLTEAEKLRLAQRSPSVN